MMRNIVLVTLIVLLCAATAQAALSDKLVDYWDFEGDLVGEHDSRTFSNTDTFTNSTAKLGSSSRYFNGSAHLSGVDIGDFNGLPISVNMWIRPTTTSGNNYFFALDKNALWSYACQVSNGALKCMNDGSESSGGSISSNTWYMITAVYESNNLRKFYLDGVNIFNNTASKTFSSNTWDEFTLGVLSTGYLDDYFDGQLDEVSIYNGSLNQTEIETLYNSGAAYGYSSITGAGGEGININDDLISWYAGNSTTVVDSSDAGINPSSANVLLTSDKNGVSNSAYNFTGSDIYHITTNSENSIFNNVSSPRSFSFWIYVDEFTNNDRPFRQRDDAGIIDIFFDGSELDARLYDGTYHVLNSGFTSTDTWAHVVLTYDGTDAALYVNNVSVSNATGVGALTAPSPNKQVWGKDENDGAEAFAGRLDEIRIYNKSLTHSDVGALYACYDDCGGSTGTNNFPIPSIVNPSNTTDGLSQITIEYKATDDYNLSVLKLWLGGGENIILNTTISPSNNTIYRSHRTLQAGGSYIFIAEACDGNNQCSNSTPLSYSTQNNFPSHTLNSPSSGDTNTSINTILNITVFDNDLHTINVTFYQAQSATSNGELIYRFAAASDGHLNSCTISSDYTNLIGWLNNYGFLNRTFFVGDLAEATSCQYTAIEDYVNTNLNSKHLFIGGNHDKAYYDYIFDDDATNDWAADWHGNHSEAGYNFVYLNSTEQGNQYNCTYDGQSQRCQSTSINTSWVNNTLNGLSGSKNTFIFVHEPQIWIPNIDIEASNNNTVLESIFQYHSDKIIAIISGHDHDNIGCHNYAWGDDTPIWRCFDGRFGGNWGVTKGYRLFNIYDDGTITTSYVYGATNTTTQTYTLLNNTDTILGTSNNNNNNTHAIYNWNTLSYGTTYYWYAVLSDGYDSVLTSTYNFTTTSEQVTINDTLFVNLTFNTDLTDYSNYSHTFSAFGTAAVTTDRDACLYYGCLNLTTAGNDFINTTLEIDSNPLGIAISFYIYSIRDIVGESMGHMYIGTGVGDLYLTDDDYGAKMQLKTATGTISAQSGAGDQLPDGRWVHYFYQYDSVGDLLQIYQDGTLIENSTKVGGSLNISTGDPLHIGIWELGIRDIDGYVDEWRMWTRGNFTQSEVTSIYNEHISGTPPEADYAILNASYLEDLYNLSGNNELILEDADNALKFTVEFGNIGSNTSTPATNYVIEYANGTDLCTGGIDALGPGASESVNCSVPRVLGMTLLYARIDTNNSLNETNYYGSESNNLLKLPFLMTHRRTSHLDRGDEEAVKAYSSNPSNTYAYQSYYGINAFSFEDFMPARPCDEVDYRGKKGQQNAMKCFMNNYSHSSCDEAKNHIAGYLYDTCSPSSYQDVQAAHGLIETALAFDWMFYNLTESEVRSAAEGMHDIAAFHLDSDNFGAFLSDQDDISGDNGQGFGQGLYGIWWYSLGLVEGNEFGLYFDADTQYPRDMYDTISKRQHRFFLAYKNDSNYFYPEGFLYQRYGHYRLDNMMLYLLNNDAFPEFPDIRNYYCGIAATGAAYMLDQNYRGDLLRDDNYKDGRSNSRFWSMGSSTSYHTEGEEGAVGFSRYLTAARICNQTAYQQVAKNLYETAFDNAPSKVDQYKYGMQAWTSYYYLKDLESKSPAQVLDPLMYSYAYGYLNWRPTYTYSNDTSIVITGGDEGQSGHPWGEGAAIGVYMLGEPFFDYPQNEDENIVQTELWHNTVAHQNYSAVGGYQATCNDYAIDQYYGSFGCTNGLQANFPNITEAPLTYRGDFTDVLGSENLFGARVFEYYNTADPYFTRYVVGIGNTVAHFDVFPTNTSPIYHNFLNIYDEFSPTISGTNLTLQRTGQSKYMKSVLVQANNSYSLAGGDTGQAPANDKDGSDMMNVTYGQYSWYTAAKSTKALFAHTGYQSSYPSTTFLYGDNAGLQVNRSGETDTIVFDYNLDNNVSHGGFVADGFAMATIKNSSGVYEKQFFNVTEVTSNGNFLLNSTRMLSVNIRNTSTGFNLSFWSKTIAFNIPYDKQVTVAFNASGIDEEQINVYDSDGSLIATSSEDVITFAASSGDYVVNGSDAPDSDNNPTSTIQSPDTGSSYENITSLNVSLLGTDDIAATLSAKLFINGSANITNASMSNNTVWNASISGFSYDAYVLILQVCDNASQCVNSSSVSVSFINGTPVDDGGDDGGSSGGGGGGGGGSSPVVVDDTESTVIVIGSGSMCNISVSPSSIAFNENTTSVEIRVQNMANESFDATLEYQHVSGDNIQNKLYLEQGNVNPLSDRYFTVRYRNAVLGLPAIEATGDITVSNAACDEDAVVAFSMSVKEEVKPTIKEAAGSVVNIAKDDITPAIGIKVFWIYLFLVLLFAILAMNLARDGFAEGDVLKITGYFALILVLPAILTLAAYLLIGAFL